MAKTERPSFIRWKTAGMRGHPQGIVVKLKSKNDRTAKRPRFYRGIIAIAENLTG
jgi:hypothetical protein